MKDVNTIEDVFDIVNEALEKRDEESADNLRKAIKLINDWEADDIGFRRESTELMRYAHHFIHMYEELRGLVLEQEQEEK